MMGHGSDADICFEKFPHLRGAGDLVNHFHLTLVQAARMRGASVTRLKLLCRDRGVKRWPYRALQRKKPKCHTSGETAPVDSLPGNTQDPPPPSPNANPRVLTQTSDHCCDPPTVITTYLHRWSLALFTVGKTPNSGHTTVSKPSDHC